MKKFKYVGRHPQDLRNGRVLGLGDVIDLTDAEARDPEVVRMLGAGDLIAERPRRRPAVVVADPTNQKGGEE